MSDRNVLADSSTASASEHAGGSPSAVIVDKPESQSSMLVDNQRYTYLPLGDGNDPRVILLRKLGTPDRVMALVWRCAMRVQGAVQNSVFEATGSMAFADGDDADRDRMSAVFMGFAMGIALAARNGHLSPSGFSTLVKVARDAANLLGHTDDIRRLAEANGHVTADTTIN